MHRSRIGTKRALSGLPTASILLFAVAVMGISLLIWSNSTLMTQQTAINTQYSDIVNKMNEEVFLEFVWFAGASDPTKVVYIYATNIGDVGLTISEIKLVVPSNGTTLKSFTISDVELKQTDSLPIELAYAWQDDTLVDLIVTTARGSSFATQLITPQCIDDDGDGILGCVDNCPYVSNPLQTDSNSDGVGDACDADNDGIRDSIENSVGGTGIDVNTGQVTYAILFPSGVIEIKVKDSGQEFTFWLPSGTQTSGPGDEIRLEINPSATSPEAKTKNAILPAGKTKKVTLPIPTGTVSGDAICIEDISLDSRLEIESILSCDFEIPIPFTVGPPGNSATNPDTGLLNKVIRNSDGTVTISGLKHTFVTISNQSNSD